MRKSILKSIGSCALFVTLQSIVGAVFLFLEFWKHPEIVDTLDVDNPFMMMTSPYILQASIYACIVSDVVIALIIMLASVKAGDLNRFVRKVTMKEVVLLTGFTSMCWLIFNVLEQILPKSTFYGSVTMNLYDYSPMLFALYSGLIAPIVEELVCRFFIIGSFSEDKKVYGVLVSAILFGVIHGNLQQGIPATLIGIILGMLYVRSKNIVLPIVFHLIFNNLSVLTMLTNNFGSTVILVLLILVITKTIYTEKFITLFERYEDINEKDFCVFRDC